MGLMDGRYRRSAERLTKRVVDNYLAVRRSNPEAKEKELLQLTLEACARHSIIDPLEYKYHRERIKDLRNLCYDVASKLSPMMKQPLWAVRDTPGPSLAISDGVTIALNKYLPEEIKKKFKKHSKNRCWSCKREIPMYSTVCLYCGARG